MSQLARVGKGLKSHMVVGNSFNSQQGPWIGWCYPKFWASNRARAFLPTTCWLSPEVVKTGEDAKLPKEKLAQAAGEVGMGWR